MKVIQQQHATLSQSMMLLMTVFVQLVTMTSSSVLLTTMYPINKIVVVTHTVL